MFTETAKMCPTCGKWRVPQDNVCPCCGEPFARPRNVAPPSVRSGEWVDALERANAALRAVMNRTESMNAHELSLACNNTIGLLQEAVAAHRSASTGQDQVPRA